MAVTSTTRGADQPHRRAKIVALLLLLVGANLAVWAWAITAFAGHPALIGTALLAYVLGLRHAVDADHIAAIDNVVRKLMHDGRKPFAVGLFFSSGHAAVVILASAAVATGAAAMQERFDSFREVGGLISTSISALFLLLIGITNLIVLRGVWKSFKRARQGYVIHDEDLDLLLAGRGFLARLFRPLFGLITRSWHMFPLGFLFGLGFETATEVSLFAVAASQAGAGISFWSVMVFPALFTAGMVLVDTLDSVLMVEVYGWAFVKPVRKLWYNLTITAVSVVVALFIASIEVLGIMREQLGLDGGFWSIVENLNGHMGDIGFVVIGIFAASWAASFAIYRWRRIEESVPALPSDLR
jgi:high-affinity nickel-transport protein